MDRARILLFFAFMGVFSATYQAGSMSEVGEETAGKFMAEFEEIVRGIDAFGIFTHNTLIALPMFVPGFGIAWGLFSAWSTGFAFAAITVTAPELAGIPALSILFLSPFGLMEIAAYSLGISRSFILILAIVRKTGIVALWRPTAIEAGTAVALLLAGGYVEDHMIGLIRDGEMGMPGLT